MKPPEEEVVRKIIGEWIYKNDRNIASAEPLQLQNPPPLCPSCFHSQQAAEKYLKAFLTRRQVKFPNTHSIREILNPDKTVDEKLAAELLPATALTHYGFEVRYPGDIFESSQRETEDALSLVKKVKNAVNDRLEEIQ